MFLCPQWWVLARCRRGGLVLIELLMVVALLGLMTGIAMLGFGAMWGDTHFKSRAEQLVNTFQMAYEAALQSDRRYAVILDQLNNVYILRQFETLDLQTLPDDEAIITVGRFDEDFQFDYVLYDDLEDTRERGESFTEARFYAGRAGWQFGGKGVRDRRGGHGRL